MKKTRLISRILISVFTLSILLASISFTAMADTLTISNTAVKLSKGGTINASPVYDKKTSTYTLKVNLSSIKDKTTKVVGVTVKASQDCTLTVSRVGHLSYKTVKLTKNKVTTLSIPNSFVTNYPDKSGISIERLSTVYGKSLSVGATLTEITKSKHPAVVHIKVSVVLK